jgi:CDP-4-dehydro-6-deoxyglucose reductase, E1
MKIKLIKNTFYKEIDTKIKLTEFIMNSSKLSMGDQCVDFENSFSKFHKFKHGVLVNSGSSANLLLIQALLILGKLKKGDKIGVSALTWSTNVMPLIQLGLIPVPIDVNKNTLNVDLENLKSSHEQDTLKGFFITNLLGFCSNLSDIVKYCESEKILLFEDNCESLGSKHSGKLLGTFGIASTSSFFVGHHLSTIEGGMVITDDEDLNDALLIARAHGWSRNLENSKQDKLKNQNKIDDFYDKYTFYDLGFNLRPTELTGLIGNIQIQYLDEMISKREENFLKFNNVAKSNSKFIELNTESLNLVSNFAFPLIFNNTKDYLNYRKRFIENGVEIRPIVSGNIIKQPFFKKYSSKSYSLKNATFIHENGFYFPNNPDLNDEEIKILIDLLK